MTDTYLDTILAVLVPWVAHCEREGIDPAKYLHIRVRESFWESLDFPKVRWVAYLMVYGHRIKVYKCRDRSWNRASRLRTKKGNLPPVEIDLALFSEIDDAPAD